MTPFFIKQFKAKHECPRCGSVATRSMCERHLTMARNHWRVWSAQRREEGLCSYCHRKSFRGWIRCRLHTAYNREKCKRWMAKYGKMRYMLRKEMGVCPKSPEHPKPHDGHIYCDNCLAYLRIPK